MSFESFLKTKTTVMRVVLKNLESGTFLQPNAAWLRDRETAKDFGSAVVAYWWALARGLQGTEVWAAFDAPEDDFACIKVESGLSRAIINCEQSEWEPTLRWHLCNGLEVDLLNFDQRMHRCSCELIAQAFVEQFTAEYNPARMSVQFRRKKPERYDFGSRDKRGTVAEPL